MANRPGPGGKCRDVTRVLLIDIYGWQGAVCSNRPYPNLGIAYLSAALERSGHQVAVLDMNNAAISDRQILSFIEQNKVDLVGLSVKTSTMKATRRVGQLISAQFPNVPLVLGGPHATIAATKLVSEPWVTAIYCGEGEEAFPRICDALDSGEALHEIPGLLTAEAIHSGIPVTPVRVEALDSLPFPNFQIFPAEVFSAIKLDYPLLTSRGCPYGCTYCSVPAISGRRFRSRSPANILSELSNAKECLGIRKFHIIDDAFNVDSKRAKEICHELIRNEVDFIWSCPNGLRADLVDEELAKLMYQSGCRAVMVGIESVDPAVLAAARKGESITDIERGIHLLRQTGMTVGGYFIIGLPGDSPEAQEEAVNFARRNNISAHFNMLVPYPGTLLWDWVTVNGRLLGDIEESLHFADSPAKVAPIFETNDFTAGQRLEAYRLVHTRTGRFDLLIPSRPGTLAYFLQVMKFLWQYDRGMLCPWVLNSLMALAKRA